MKKFPFIVIISIFIVSIASVYLSSITNPVTNTSYPRMYSRLYQGLYHAGVPKEDEYQCLRWAFGDDIMGCR